MEQCIKFKGEKIEHTDYRELLIISFPSAFVLSLGILGEKNFLCLIFYTLCLLLMFYLLLRISSFCLFRFIIKFRGFTLDDNAQNIITEKGRIIPYNKVKAVSITKNADFLTVRASLGIFTKHLILRTGNIKKENELFSELKNRFVKVRIRNMHPIILPSAIAFLLVSLTCFIYFRYPEVRIFPEKKIQKTQKFSGPERYTFNKINFLLPNNFKLKEKKEDRHLYFCNQTEKVGISVSSVSLLSLCRDEYYHEYSGSLTLFTFQLGLKNDYEFLNVIYNSHAGLLPLGIKLAFVRQYTPETVKIYEIRKNEFRGFLISGRLKNEKMKNEADLTVVNKKSGHQIIFYIRSENKIKDSLVDMLINGLE